MTDTTAFPGIVTRPTSIHTDDAAKARLKKRYAAELRFKWLGAGAVGLAALFLVLLLSTIVTEAIPALRINYTDAAARSFGGEGRPGQARHGRLWRDHQ